MVIFMEIYDSVGNLLAELDVSDIVGILGIPEVSEKYCYDYVVKQGLDPDNFRYKLSVRNKE